MSRKYSLARQIKIQKLQNKNKMVGKTFNPSGVTSESLQQKEKDLLEKYRSMSKKERYEAYLYFQAIDKYKSDNNLSYSNTFEQNVFQMNFGNRYFTGFEYDKIRFEKMLGLYTKNASKFSTSEINDINEVFELGKEFFGVDVELPVVKKQKKFVCAPTRNTTVETPQRSIPAVYSIVELTDLITSNTPHNFKPDPRYPDKCQQRDYLTDKSEQEKVRVGAKHFNPAIIINNAPTASDGPAIVNNKHFVLGGNGRTMMMKLLSKEKYSEYLEKLKCDLDIFGLTANDLKGYIQPCLVREVDMKVQECALFSNILNQNLTQDIDLVTKTVSFARQLSETDIKHIAMLFENTDSDTLASMLSDKKVVSKLQEIFRSAGIITAQNTSKWLVDSHIFTNEGKLATEGILLGTVLENKNLIEAARSFTEKIIRTIPLLLRMKNLPKEWNMIDDIQNVVKLEYERRKMNVPIDDYIAQISFDKPDVKEKEELVWKVIAEGSWLKWKNFLDKYVKMGEDAQELEASGGGMFGETVKPMDAIRRLSGMKNSLNDSLSGYSDDKTRFETMLGLYTKNASKFSTSEINDLNEVFELGKEFFGVDVELPVVKKEVANGLERDPLRPNFQKDLLKLVGEEFNCQAYWESKNPKPFETVSVQDAKYLEARWDNTGKTIGIRVKLPTKQFVDIQYIMNAVNREEVYTQFSEKFKKILDKMGIGENLTIYPTTYGIGTFIAFGNRGNIAKKLNEVLDKAGISYTNEYSDARYVYRYKISKSQENIKKLDKFLQDASLNDSLSGYSDDKTRFEKMLTLYKKNASKFSTSEINDLNEVFELGKEFFDVDVELPKGETKKKAGKIEKYEDYGEKIGGAKKDLYHRMEELKQLSSDDFINLPLSKTFPKPDYVQLYKDGILTHDGAFALKFMYEAIAKKPRQSYKQAKWAKQVRSVIEIMTDTLFNNPETSDKFSEHYKSVIAGTQFNKSYKLLKALGFPNVDVNLDGYDIAQWVTYKKINPATGELEHYISKYNREKVNSDGTKGAFEDTFIPESETKYYGVTKGSETVISFHTYEEAVEFLKSRLSIGTSKPTNDKKVEFNIYRSNIGTKQIFIGKKMATGVVDFSVGIEFKTVGEARKYLNEKYDEVLQRFNDLKINFQERRSTNRPRVGKDWRNGENITPEKFAKTFGFRGIEFGNWVNSAERQMHINEAYEALMDLSFATGLPAGAIALNGELGLAFGARGSGNANAHYEPEKIVINLTKTRGSGSLAHEWFHALDNYFSRVRGYKHDYITEKAYPHMDKSTGKLSVAVRQEIIDSFKALHDVLRKSDLHKRSEKLDSTRSKLYWSTGIEMGARCFENYVVDTLEKSGITNDYLSNFKEEWQWEKDYKQGSYPYPSEEESPIFNSTYQKIFDTIETKKHEEKDVLALSDSYDQPQQSFPTIPSGVGRELGNLFARAPQRSFVRLMQNAGVANVAIRLLRQQNIITDANKSAWITDSVTFTPNGITLLKEGLWKLLFPHTLTSDYPEQVTDKILKNLSAFLQLKSNGTLFLQFEIALELGKDWNNDGRTFEEYCSATVFDNPLDAQEFAVLCPILWEMNNDKFDYILQQYVKSYSQSDRATFLRNLSTEIGTRVSRQKTHSLSDVYIWK